jgi:hypothetical protein
MLSYTQKKTHVNHPRPLGKNAKNQERLNNTFQVLKENNHPLRTLSYCTILWRKKDLPG